MKKAILIFVIACFCGCSSQTYLPETSSASRSQYTTSIELESVTDELYSSIPEEIPETFNDDKTIALRKEKCTETLVDSFQRGIVHELKCSSEQEIIYDLMDRDVICYYTFRYASSAIEQETPY